MRQGDMITIGMAFVELRRSFHGMRVACHERRATLPLHPITWIRARIRSTRSLPSHTIPNPPLMALPIPTPPPLCKATRLMPWAQFPAKHCTAISAITLLPSLILEVSRKGESVPPSWWVTSNMIGTYLAPAYHFD